MSELSSRQSGANSKSRPPQYRRMKRGKGRADSAVTYIDGKRVLLGEWKSPESRAKFAELVGDSTSVDTTIAESAGPVTVNEMLVAYFEHAQVYYRQPDGELSREYDHVRRAAGMLRDAVGNERAQDIGPKRIKLIREEMIGKGWTRNFINDHVKRIVRMFRWAASEELIEAKVPDAMQTIEGLRHGKTNAKESKIVRPVDDATIKATVAKLPAVVADMVTFQRLTACRPGEMVQMRPCDLDRSGEAWLYVPEHHKTECHGHGRTIAVGPKAQAVLLRYLARDARACCFQPRDSESKRLAARSAARKTPLSCGNSKGSNRTDTPKRAAGESYSVASYRRAIERACKRAGVEKWTPHRLRHTAATEVRREFGLDAVQAILGHRNAQISQVYAELDTAKAAAVAMRIG